MGVCYIYFTTCARNRAKSARKRGVGLESKNSFPCVPENYTVEYVLYAHDVLSFLADNLPAHEIGGFKDRYLSHEDFTILARQILPLLKRVLTLSWVDEIIEWHPRGQGNSTCTLYFLC